MLGGITFYDIFLVSTLERTLIFRIWTQQCDYTKLRSNLSGLGVNPQVHRKFDLAYPWQLLEYRVAVEYLHLMNHVEEIEGG